ncbi:hypothetical protein NliqN6_2452 [Naganishia liquefaciens]|uniref:F-box domain-containing protein n=1 Tax=Naganishia liquefaciens TaxID=104408 RepID=A0A8H3YE14_9TREE|nr:hypothetical protein NliqN6_2452 [Naganishia liquefaciens]
MAQIPALPLDVIFETLNHLPSEDLLRCQRVCRDFRHLVQKSNDLQLRMHLEDNGMWPASHTDIYQQPQSELARLREIESRLATGHFGSSDPKRKRVRLSEGDPEAMHSITIANGYLFTPWQYGGSFEGMTGVARYQLDDLSLPPEIRQFGKPVRHYQIDSAEGVLLVVFLEDEYRHSIRLYDVESLEPLDVPSIDAEFSARQMSHPLTQIHIRGHFLAITCEESRDRTYGTQGYKQLRLEDFKPNFACISKIQDPLAGSVTPRILSSRALALLETRERDSALHIIAYWAKDSLSRPQEDPVDPVFPFKDWAPSTLSWIQPHSVRPTRDSLCGYRLALAAEAFNGLDSMVEGLASLEQQTLEIIDLNPVHIKKERYMALRGDKPSRYPNGLEVVTLSSGEPVAQNSSETAYLQSDNFQAEFERVLMTRSATTAHSTVFQKESKEYATEAPYILLKKRITINPSSTSFVSKIPGRGRKSARMTALKGVLICTTVALEPVS